VFARSRARTHTHTINQKLHPAAYKRECSFYYCKRRNCQRISCRCRLSLR